MALIHLGKRHDAYAFILETLVLFFWGSGGCSVGRAATLELPTPEYE